MDFLVVAPWLRPFVVEIDGEGYHVPAIDADRDQALARAGYEVLRVPARELESGSGPGLDSVAERWVAGPVEDDHDIITLALEPVLLHQLAEAVLWAIELGLLRGERWVVHVSDPLGHIAELFAPFYLDLFSAIDELWDGRLMPAQVDLVGSTIASFRRDGIRYQRVVDTDVAMEPDVVIRLEPFLRPTDLLERQHRTPEIVVRPMNLPFCLAPPRFDESSRVRLPTGRDVREPLRVVLRSLFAKEAFWPGQYEAIVQLLSGRDCAVLLPTGAGKSLIYQLSGLCMPGRTLVVDPTIALMEDQVERLRANGIDRVAGISSHEVRAGRGEQLLRLVMSGDALYVFVSPERLQQDTFRNALAALSVTHHVNLVAIDEAHCVSEWGHDFRPAYLGLGDTVRRFCVDAGGSPPPLVALTGTASRTVLLDVLVELGIDPADEHALIRPESFDREELEFGVWVTEPAAEEGTLKGVLNRLPTAFGLPRERFFRPAGHDTACGILFCPHVNGPHGVVEVANRVREIFGFQPPIFAGTTPRGFDERGFALEKRENARRFRANDVAVLVATKAFGMGIDKPNVRWVVHYGIPASMEAYYQEVGRAGRDGNRAVCWLILSDLDEARSRRLLRTNAPFKEAKEEWAEAREQAEDDVTRQLWFLYQAFPGETEELDRLRRMVQEIQPLGRAREARIPMNGDDRARDRERALYRLKVLGVVSDYSVDWGAKTYTVRLAEVNPAAVPQALVRYVERTDPARAAVLREDLEARNLTDLDEAVEDCAKELLKFVYDRIAGSRRRSLHEMWLAARHARGPDADAELRRRILDYLTEGDIAKKLDELVERTPFLFADWTAFLHAVMPGPDARELRGASGRLLESFPDHPGLLLARGIAELLLAPNGDLDDAAENLERAFRSAREVYRAPRSDLDPAAEAILEIASSHEGALIVALAVVRSSGVGEEAARRHEERFLREAAPPGAAVVALAGRLDDWAIDLRKLRTELERSGV